MLKVIALVTLDYLVIFSCTFLVLYFAALLLASLIPAEWKVSPSSLSIPLVAGLSVALMFTPWEAFLTGTLRWLTTPIFSGEQAAIETQHRILLAVWLGGMAVLLCVYVGRLMFLFEVLRGCDDVSHDPAFAQALETTGLRRAVRLKCSPAFKSVASWGLYRPCVLVPENFEAAFTHSERYALYLHELTHIQKHDSHKHLFAGLVSVFFWFNPVSFHALRRFKNHLEVACDRAVIRLGVDATSYADLIGRFIAAKRNKTPALHFSSAYKDAARRFRYIFDDASFLPAKADRYMALRCLAVFGIVTILAFVFPREDLGKYPKSGQTREQEFANGEVVKEYYVFARQGVIGNFTRTRVVGRGYVIPVDSFSTEDAYPKTFRP